MVAASPESEMPAAAIYPAFRASDVARILDRPGLGDDSDRWTEVLMGAVPELSQLLMPLLSEQLDAMSKAAELLYIVTDGPLVHAPLAALGMPTGITLAELIPFAMLPFASLLQVEDKQKSNVPVSAAVVAVGTDAGV